MSGHQTVEAETLRTTLRNKAASLSFPIEDAAAAVSGPSPPLPTNVHYIHTFLLNKEWGKFIPASLERIQLDKLALI